MIVDDIKTPTSTKRNWSSQFPFSLDEYIYIYIHLVNNTDLIQNELTKQSISTCYIETPITLLNSL